MEVLITLGIYDDGDVAPTLTLCHWDTLDSCVTPQDLPRELSIIATEMRAAGEAEYGRPVPDHALFWYATPKPESLAQHALEQAT